jgi:putative ABC transport system permease protein
VLQRAGDACFNLPPARNEVTSLDINWLEILASFALVLVAVGLSIWKGLGAEQSIIWASVRAAVQLLAVGVVFQVIFASSTALLWAFMWIVGMTIVSAEIVNKRTPNIPRVRPGAYLSLAGALAVSLGIIFGLGVFDLEPVTLVVLAGVTLGNTLPSAVLAVDAAGRAFTDHPARIEGALALGLDAKEVARLVTPQAVRTALIPQIERTKVVGLIALPGAMTGMLLAGADAVTAVSVQIVIMYLILGSVSVVVVTVVTIVAVRAFTPDVRLEDWVTSTHR